LIDVAGRFALLHEVFLDGLEALDEFFFLIFGRSSLTSSSLSSLDLAFLPLTGFSAFAGFSALRAFSAFLGSSAAFLALAGKVAFFASFGALAASLAAFLGALTAFSAFRLSKRLSCSFFP
jgi:hypothetical protein